MANVDIEIAARRYTVACRDGEQDHLREVAALVDRKARDAEGAVGSLSETRQLLFASLLLADELHERRSAQGEGREPADDLETVSALERLAGRIESLADRLESAGASA
jgi:cell division protein ZapA